MTAPIIILGAHGGIGEALARRLADRGHDLFLTARDKDSISDLGEELGAKTASLDVMDPDAIAEVIGKADQGDGIAGLAYCVGSIVLKPLKSASADDFGNHSVISAAKGGVEGLTRALAAELAPEIRVNAIAPSITDTGIAKKLLSSESMARGLGEMHPVGRYGKPEDVAAMAATLLDADAGWITGQVIGVDGGRGALRTRNQ